MGVTVAHIQTHVRTGRLSFRRGFPADLRPFIPGQKRELKRSLGSTSLSDPEAARRFSEASAEYDRIIASARKAASGAFDPLDDPTIRFIADVYRTRCLEEDDRNPLTLAQPIEEALEYIDLSLSEARDHLAERDSNLIVRLFKDDALAAAASKGLLIDPKAESFPRLCKALLEAHIAVLGSLEARYRGHIVPTPAMPDPPQPATRAPGLQASDGRTIDALIAAYERDNAGGWTVSTRKAYVPIWRLLRDVLGPEYPIASINREDGRTLFEAVKAVPKNMGKLSALRGLTVPQAIERAEVLGLERLAPKTVNDVYLAYLKAVFRWAQAEQWIVHNPVERFSVDDPVSAADKRDPFRMDQLQALFNAAPWKPMDAAPRGRPLLFWGPLIALFHGMRRGEIAQLQTGDIQVREGLTVILIRPGDGKKIKTENARRMLPVHPELVRMGFLDFVAERQRSGDVQLFTGEKADNNGEWGDHWSDWFLRLLKKRGITGRKVGLHSFRHCFQDRQREAGLQMTAIGQELAGRSRGGEVSNDYGRGFSTKALADAVAKIVYPDLDLSHIRWTPPS